MILKNFPLLSVAYYLKESYRSFNASAAYEGAKERLEELIREFESADIPQYREFTSLLKHWRREILNSFLRPYEDRKLSNAFCENINGKLRTYLTLSRGIANFDRFRKRALFALDPHTFYSLTSVLSNGKHEGRKRGSYRKPQE